jgi:hypothetical protein
MADSKQPYRGTTKPQRMSNLYLARFGWPATADTENGPVIVAFAADGALLVGDAVVVSTVGKVKTATSGAPVGIVVGGIINGSPAIFGLGSVGYSIPTGSVVFVAIAGIAFAVTTGTVNIGDQLIHDTSTGGKLKTGTTAGSIFGKALSASAISATVTVLVALS